MGEPEWVAGTVTIDSIRFENLRLRYDICTNQLVLNTINLTDSHIQVALNNSKINSFTLGSKIFIPDPTSDTPDDPWFFEVLASGDLSLLMQESKQLKVPINGVTNYNYEAFSKMKLLHSNTLINYKGKKTLYKIYPKLRTPIRNFIRNEKLRLSNKHPENHARLVEYCNHIILDQQ